LTNDLKSYKERCKDYEHEIEQIRGFENNSVFGNASMIGGKSVMGCTNTTQGGTKYDYEIK
jgi:hypothetical protein